MELAIDRLTKQYKNKIAVDRVSIKLKPGVYGLLGANGAGKSTLIKILCGIYHADLGEIILNGKNVEFKNEYSNLMINFSEQKPNLDFSLEKINDDEYRISADFDIYEVTIFRGNKYKYIFSK